MMPCMVYGVKEKHLRKRNLAQTKGRIDSVKLVNCHFEGKLKRRMKTLTAVMEKSKQKDFVRRERPWKSKFKEVMSEKRNSNN